MGRGRNEYQSRDARMSVGAINQSHLAVVISIPIRGKQKYDPVKLARSLYKVALGTAAFDLGKKGYVRVNIMPPEISCSEKALLRTTS